MHRPLLLFALAAALPTVGCEAKTARSRPAASTVPLSVRSSNGVHMFRVEVASTAEQQEKGLMFRTHLDAKAGMIFPMEPPRIASFWMKNTVVPLDMIFVGPDGTIESIAAETVPYSLTPVTSGGPVAAVLEIAGGRAAEIGIAAGDKVSWPH